LRSDQFDFVGGHDCLFVFRFIPQFRGTFLHVDALFGPGTTFSAATLFPKFTIVDFRSHPTFPFGYCAVVHFFFSVSAELPTFRPLWRFKVSFALLSLSTHPPPVGMACAPLHSPLPGPMR